jgi:hypothetical protein
MRTTGAAAQQVVCQDEGISLTKLQHVLVSTWMWSTLSSWFSADSWSSLPEGCLVIHLTTNHDHQTTMVCRFDVCTRQLTMCCVTVFSDSVCSNGASWIANWNKILAMCCYLQFLNTRNDTPHIMFKSQVAIITSTIQFVDLIRTQIQTTLLS